MNKNKILKALLQNLHCVQPNEVIQVSSNGDIFVEGKILTPDEQEKFLRSVEALSNNYALKFVRNQVARECVKIGVYQAINEDQIMFAKAALFYQQEENKLFANLINR